MPLQAAKSFLKYIIPLIIFYSAIHCGCTSQYIKDESKPYSLDEILYPWRYLNPDKIQRWQETKSIKVLIEENYDDVLKDACIGLLYDSIQTILEYRGIAVVGPYNDSVQTDATAKILINAKVEKGVLKINDDLNLKPNAAKDIAPGFIGYDYFISISVLSSDFILCHHSEEGNYRMDGGTNDLSYRYSSEHLISLVNERSLEVFLKSVNAFYCARADNFIKMRNPDSLLAVSRMLSDPDSRLREQICRMLGLSENRSEQTDKLLIESLDHPYLDTRRLARCLLSVEGNENEFIIQSASKHMHDANPETRLYGIEELELIRDSRGLELLIESLKDEDEVVRNAAYHNLKFITCEDMGFDHQKWQEWLATTRHLWK